MEKISEVTTIFLLNAVWQVAVIGLAGFAASRFTRGLPMSYKHRLWSALLILCFAVPIFSTVKIGLFGKALETRNEKFEFSIDKENPLSELQSSEINWFERYFNFNGKIAAALSHYNSLIPAGYFVFILFSFFLLARKWINTRKICDGMERAYLSSRIEEIFCRCKKIFHIESVGLFTSSAIVSPVTVGVFQPVIILPKDFLKHCSAEQITAVFGHEMAHINRRDYFMNLCYEILSVFVCFHPMMWFIRRQVGETREMAVDKIVAEKLLDKTIYARSLVQISSSFAQPSAHALGISDGQILEKRIKNLVIGEVRGSFKKVVSTSLIIGFAITFTAFITVKYSINIQRPVTQTDLAQLGKWNLYFDPQSEKRASQAVLNLRISDDGLGGTATIYNERSEYGDRAVPLREFTLIDPRIDESHFSFSVNNGEEFLNGELNRTGDSFSGEWTSSESNQQGLLKMAR